MPPPRRPAGARAPRPIDRRSPVPLWAQLEADLRRRIAAGGFTDRFPTDEELVSDYEVSRHTAREAVRRLTEDGTVVRERGRGTTLAAGRLDRPLGRLYSLFEAVEAGGIDQRSELLDERTTTSAEVATHLGLPDDAELVLVVRLRRAGEDPLALDRVWLPAELGRPLLGVDWTRTSLYEQLAGHGGRRPDAGWERIRAVDPPASDRRRLQLGAGAAAFCIERLGLVDGTPVEYRRSMVRGDRFAFLTEWSAERTSSELHLTDGTLPGALPALPD